MTSRPVTSLGHQGWRGGVFWKGPIFFKLCPIVFNYAQHIFPGGGAKNFVGGLLPPGYGSDDVILWRQKQCISSDNDHSIRHCSILDFGRGHAIKHSSRASRDLCTPLIYWVLWRWRLVWRGETETGGSSHFGPRSFTSRISIIMTWCSSSKVSAHVTGCDPAKVLPIGPRTWYSWPCPPFQNNPTYCTWVALLTEVSLSKTIFSNWKTTSHLELPW